MKTFFCKYVDQEGHVSTCFLQGKEEVDIEISLKNDGKTLITARKQNVWRRFFNKIILYASLKEFFFNLSSLLREKLTLVEALEVLKFTVKNKELALALYEVVEDIKNGLSFSSSIARHSIIFGSFAVKCIRSAEISGKMHEALSTLGDFFATKVIFAEKRRRALIYPLCVFTAILALLFITLFYVVPSVKDFMIEGGNLGINQKIIFFLSDFVINNSFTALIIISSLLFLLYFWQKRKGRGIFSIVNKEAFEMIFWIKTVATSLQSGIVLKEALLISGEQVKNEGLKDKINEVIKLIENGESFYKAVSRIKNISKSVPYFAKLGESCGRLGDMLLLCSEVEFKKFSNKIEKIMSLLQPLLLFIAGIILIWILFAIMIPLYSIFPS